MSGPKSSRYTLSPEQLRIILEEQERIRRELEEQAKKERECKEAKEVLNGILKNTLRHVADVKDARSRLQTLAKERSDTIAGNFSRFYSSADKLIALASEKMTDHSELMAARTTAEHLISALVQLKNELIVGVQDLHTQQATQEMAVIADAMSVSFANVGVVEEEVDQTVVDTIEMLERLVNQTLPESLRDEINASIEYIQSLEDHASVENYIALTVTPIKKKVKVYQTFQEEYGQQFDALRDRYYGLCTCLGVSPKDYEPTQSGMSALEHEIKLLEAQHNKDAERAYISQALDEVMREMGYNVIGSRHVTKRSGKSFTSKLLTYDDGAVVNVTESSSGQITMEIGSTDVKDRTPDANERVALRKKMEQFCMDFREIEKRLVERGVVLDSRLAMAPPEEMYAQIINLSDYDLYEEYRHYVGKRQSEASKVQQAKMRNE